MADRHRQGADVIVVAMGQGDGVHVLAGNGGIERQAGVAFALGMGAGVHEEAVAVHFRQPGAGANVGVGVEINDAHGGI